MNLSLCHSKHWKGLEILREQRGSLKHWKISWLHRDALLSTLLEWGNLPVLFPTHLCILSGSYNQTESVHISLSRYYKINIFRKVLGGVEEGYKFSPMYKFFLSKPH